MSLTHLKGLSITPDPRGSTALEVTGTVSLSAITGALAVSGTLRSSGIFSASASGKQSTLTKLAVTGTGVVSGAFTASASGKQTTLTKVNVSGTAAISGKLRATNANARTEVSHFWQAATSDFIMVSGANSQCGRKLVATAGLGRVANTRVTAAGRIILTPFCRSGLRPVAYIAAQSAGTAFQIGLQHLGVGTIAAATGTVNWLIVKAA